MMTAAQCRTDGEEWPEGVGRRPGRLSTLPPEPDSASALLPAVMPAVFWSPCRVRCQTIYDLIFLTDERVVGH